MELDKQTYELTFSEGVDTNTDPKLLMPSSLLNLENGVFKKGGKIQKRFGYSELSRETLNLLGSRDILSDVLSTSSHLEEMLLHTKHSLFSFSSASNVWLEKGKISPFINTATEIVHTTKSKLRPDMTINSNVELYAYENELLPKGLYYTVVDSLTGVSYQYDMLLSLTGKCPRCISLESGLYIVYIDYDVALTSVIDLALDLRTTMNTHAASTGGGGAHAHADNINFPIAPVTLVTLEDVINFVISMRTAYTAHNADANLAAARAFHNARQLGNSLDISLNAPTDIQSCVAAINDLSTSYTGHKTSVVSHGAVVGTLTATAAVTTSSINMAKFNMLNLVETPTIITLDLNGSNSNFMDAVSIGNNISVLWSNADSPVNLMEIGIYNSEGNTGPTYGLPTTKIVETAAGDGIDAETALCLRYKSITNRLWVFGNNYSTGSESGTDFGLFGGVYSSSLQTILPMTLIEDTSKILPIINITCEFNTSTIAEVWYEVNTKDSGSTTEFNYIRKSSLNTSGVVGTPEVFKYNCGLVIKAFNLNSTIYLGLAYQSPINNSPSGTSMGELQPSYFIVDDSGTIRGKVLNLSGTGYTDHLAKTTTIGDKVYTALEKAVAIDDSVSNKTQKTNDVFIRSLGGISKIELDFNSEYLHFISTINNVAHLSGGQVEIYDGKSVVESGFHLFSEGATLLVNASGGLVPKSLLYYCFVWKWVDSKGNVYRSDLSPLLECDNSGGTATASIDITVPSLTITNKQDAVLEIYRNVTSGETFYKVAEIDNDITASHITFRDIYSDANIESNEYLYTTGGVVEKVAVPSTKLITSWKNRLWCIGEDNYLWYTPEKQDNVGMSFNDYAYRIPLDIIGGDITAIAPLDDNFILFTASKIYFMNGEGANDLGVDSQLSNIQQINSDVGCINPNSLVIVPTGIMFKSDKGIYIIDRNHQVIYVGSKVSKYNENTILSAQAHPTYNEVRFLLDNQKALVYNYYFNQWSIFTNISGLDALVWDKKYIYLRSDNKVMAEDTSKYLDGGAPIQLKIETAWIKTAGIQGFQRIIWTHYLGNYEAPHNLRVDIAYNYKDYVQDSTIFTPDDILDISTYGDDSPYGSSTVYGGSSDALYQFRSKPRIQKCQSIKYTIYDTNSRDAGYSLNHMLLTVKIKGPNYKLKSTKTVE